MNERNILAALAVLACAGTAGAQDAKQEAAEAKPARTPEAARGGTEAQSQFTAPPDQPMDDRPKRLVGRMAPPHAGKNTEAGRLAAATLVAAEDGQAQVRLADGTALTLRPGTSVDGDVVKTVRGRRIVLERPARAGQPGGAALVVVDFAAAGSPRTMVLWSAYPGIAPQQPAGGR